MVSFSLFVVVTAALLCARQVDATTFPSTVEVDLIFPRNDTYAPSALFPIVFAFQNAQLVPSLDPGFDITLWDNSGRNVTGQSPVLNLKTTNFSNTDPTFVYTYVTDLNTTTAGEAVSYLLSWAFSAGNCSNIGGALTFGGGFRDNSVQFTIQNGAQQPDLVTATANRDSCVNMSHFAFNVTGTLDVTLPAQYDGHNTCAVFSDSEPLVAGNPCAVQVGSATASSIMADLTETACSAASPVVSCPSQNTASRRLHPGYTILLGSMMAAFTAVLFL